jgi:ubiquitin-like-conjugating enzyme ATG3
MKREIYEYYKKALNSISGPLIQSNFQKTGRLTPLEFIDAGDKLIKQFPYWNWAESSIDYGDNLPQNKKYLILNNCPSYERVNNLSEFCNTELNKDGWLVTKDNKKNIDSQINIKDDTLNGWVSDEDDDCVFIDEKTNYRIYDLTIIYDKYYSTPRMYLIGYDKYSQLLSREEIMEDVLAENREKTVTVDMHPYLNIPALSIHPCRHAETLKRILDRIESRFYDQCNQTDKNTNLSFIFSHSDALFVFLKFMASIVPTIQYDVSSNVEL